MKRYGFIVLLLLEMVAWAGNVQTKVLSKQEKLVEAVKTKDDAFIDQLLEEDAEIILKEQKEASILHWAVTTGSKEGVEYILVKIRERSGLKLLDYVKYKITVPVMISTLQHENWVRAVAWSPDGSKICIGSDDRAQVWDVGGKKGPMLEHEGLVYAVAWSSDGSKIGSAQRWVMVPQELLTGSGYHKYSSFKGSPVSGVWSPDKSKVCIGERRETVQVWGVRVRRYIFSIMHDARVCLAAWSPDGSKICTGSEDGSVQIWDVERRKIVATMASIYAVAWSPDGSKICTINNGKTVQVWDMGGTLLDWAVRAVSAGGEKGGLEVLLSLDEYANLEGKYSEDLLINLCHVASKVKQSQPDKYKKLCEVIEMIANKPGAPF